MKEGSFHLFFTFPSIPSKTHPPQKEKARRLFINFYFPKVFRKKKLQLIVFVLFPPDLENFKLKGVGTFIPIPFFHTQLCWPFLMYLVQHFAYIMLIFMILIFLGTIVSSFGDNFFPLKPLVWRLCSPKNILLLLFCGLLTAITVSWN